MFVPLDVFCTDVLASIQHFNVIKTLNVIISRFFFQILKLRNEIGSLKDLKNENA